MKFVKRIGGAAAIDESGVTLWDLEKKKVVAELDIGL